MIAYTLSAVLAAFFLFGADRLLLKTRVLVPSPQNLRTGILFLLFQLVFDNLFTFWGLWHFNAGEILGSYTPIVPIENLLYGQVLLWTTVLVYAYFSNPR